MKTRHKKEETAPSRSQLKKPQPQQRGAKDSPELDVYHDDNRRNMYDPELGEALKRNAEGDEKSA